MDPQALVVDHVELPSFPDVEHRTHNARRVDECGDQRNILRATAGPTPAPHLTFSRAAARALPSARNRGETRIARNRRSLDARSGGAVTKLAAIIRTPAPGHPV